MKTAIQFSGGKDSLAVVYLMRPYWDDLTVYHADTGDLLPEVMEIVDHVQALVPFFCRIETSSKNWTAKFGLPSDLVPVTSGWGGMMIGASEQPIVDRFNCCHANIMVPLNERMINDRVNMVIRGTKRADFKKLPAEDGPTEFGYRLWQPLLDWSHQQVFDYLKEVGAPICRVYEHDVQAPECATCPAWWSERRSEYLGKYHPDLYAAYQSKLAKVAAEVTPLWVQLQKELG